MDGQNVVFVDVDAVIVNPSSVFIETLNKTAGTDYRFRDITEFAYRECFPPKHAKMLEDMWKNPVLYDDMEPNPKAVEAIREMRTFARVIALSSPSIGHIDSKFRFLSREPLLFAINNIIVARDKSLMKGAVLIDDNIDNLLHFNGTRICYIRPWNTAWDKDLGLRTNRWGIIVKAVREAIALIPDEEEEEE